VSKPGGNLDGIKSIWAARTLRNGLVLVVVVALLPMAVLSALQGSAAWADARVLAANKLRANAWLVAEGERDVFTSARQAVLSASRASTVRTMGDGCSDVLADARLGTVGIINLTRSDASGRLRCSALPFKVNESFAGELWWQRATTIEGLSLSPPIIGKISGKPVLVMAMRVRGSDGTQAGVITASISLEALRASLVKRSVTNPEALVEIVDADGTVIVSNQKTALKLTGSALANNQGDSARSQDGVQWLYATAPLYGRELTVVYAEESDNVLSTALWQVRQSIFLPLIAMALASLAIWAGTHWLVVRWLRKLQALAAQFGRGDFAGNRDAYHDAPREVAALSNELHAMAETINARDTALIAALAAKTELTREVNHRVKNNLQIVTSLLTLQADRVADAYARDALGQARARIAALGLIHRVLYDHDTYNALGTVDMGLLMNELCPQLRAANPVQSGVDLRCDCEAFQVSVDQAVPLTLFIVEAVTNAYRHGYADKKEGIIRVRMAVIESHVKLNIDDDGTGYTIVDSVGKMGFELINAFASQLGGTLEMESNNAGTNVSLRYPLIRH
jgi:two-component sensor histidine kinase